MSDVSARDAVLRVRVVVHEGGGESVWGEEGADAKLRGDRERSSSSRAVSASATWSRSLALLDASSSDNDMGGKGNKDLC